MTKLFAILGISLIMAFAYLISKEKENIKWKSIILLTVSQFIMVFIMLKTPVWKLIEKASDAVSWLLSSAQEGITFVFGDLSSGWTLFFGGLMPIVFISSLVGLAFHFGILQYFVKIIAITIAKLFKVDPIVAVNGTVNMFLGQTDALFITQNYLPKAKDSVIFATLVGGMTSMSVGVLGLYAGMGAPLEYILVSLPLSVVSTFVLTQIILPTEYQDAGKLELDSEKGENFIETMMMYGNKGFKGAISVAVALMVFISVVAFINGIIQLVFPSVTLESIIGIAFYPLALLMGAPISELSLVAELLASKLVFNEAVAYGMPQFNQLTEATKAMVTVALAGFGGFGSIGILIGGYTAIAPEKVKVVCKYGVLALMTATLVNIMSAAVIGLFL